MSDRSKVTWFRAYAEMVDDEKLRLLSFEDRWHFVALLCCKASGIIDEAGPLLRRKVAVKLGLDPAALEEVARRLSEVELIDRETLQPLAWDRRQFTSDTSAERTRAYRDRLKRHGDVTVTPPEEEAEAETKTDCLLEERESSPPPSRARESRSPAGSRLPSDFPTIYEVEWCQQERPDLDASIVRAKFRDYWCGVPGQKGRKLDWPATWRNFVRSERPPARAAPSRRSSAVESGLALAGYTRKQPETIDVLATESAAPRLG